MTVRGDVRQLGWADWLGVGWEYTSLTTSVKDYGDFFERSKVEFYDQARQGDVRVRWIVNNSDWQDLIVGMATGGLIGMTGRGNGAFWLITLKRGACVF